MVKRRPLVYSGGLFAEINDYESIPVTGELTTGSGFGNQVLNLAVSGEINVNLPANASGLIWVGTKLGLDGRDLVAAEQGLASGLAADADAVVALASGLAASSIAVQALASGNAGLLAATSGMQQSDLAITNAALAIASGAAGIADSPEALASGNAAVVEANYALGSGLAAEAISTAALASGNAALTLFASEAPISEGELLGLIFALG